MRQNYMTQPKNNLELLLSPQFPLRPHSPIAGLPPRLRQICTLHIRRCLDCFQNNLSKLHEHPTTTSTLRHRQYGQEGEDELLA